MFNVTIAKILDKFEKHEQAKTIILAFLNKNLNSYIAHKLLAEFYEKEGNYEAAVSAYMRVTDLKRNDFNSAYKLCEVLNKNKQNLKEDKLFNREMLIAIIIGLIGTIILYKIPILSIIILLSTIIFCICQMYIINKKNSEKKEKVNIMIQENKKLLNKIIIEIVDFCLMYNENNINIDDFSDYINKYNPNDFIITNNDERNIIIDRKEI